MNSVCIQNNLRETAFHIACKGPDLSIFDEEQHELASYRKNLYEENSVDIIELLLKNRHDKVKGTANSMGELPFHLTCKSMFDKTLKILEMLNAKDNVSFQTCGGDTFLHLLLNIGGSSHVEEVINYFYPYIEDILCTSNSEGDLPLHIACRNTYLPPSIFKLLVCKSNVNVSNKKRNSSIHEFCIAGRKTKEKPWIYSERNPFYVEEDVFEANLHQKFQYLVDAGVKFDSPNIEGYYPLHLACRYQSLEVVKCLEPFGLVVKSFDRCTVLHEACRNTTHHALDIVEYLLEKSELHFAFSEANSEGDLFFHIACRNRSLSKIMKDIVSLNQNINATNGKGNTLLHELIENDQPTEAIMYLLEHGECNPCIVNKNSKTPLHLACSKDLKTVVESLLKMPQISEVLQLENEDSQAPIALTTDSEITQMLLDSGANPEPLYRIHKEFFSQATSPPQIPVTLLVIGNANVGKTTLVSSLRNEDQNIVTKDLPCTAGVVPSDFNSAVYGQVTMYDFAGQREYYASHDTVIHRLIKKSPPIVLLVVDLKQPIKDTIESISFWSSFIKNLLVVLTDKAHLYIICSHADIVLSRGTEPKSVVKNLLKAIELQSDSDFPANDSYGLHQVTI